MEESYPYELDIVLQRMGKRGTCPQEGEHLKEEIEPKTLKINFSNGSRDSSGIDGLQLNLEADSNRTFW